MVREARKKCAVHRPRITVSRQDMRQLHLRSRYDVATCMFDSINHLTTLRDLRAAFCGISRALNPGGWFIFDVNNESCFRTLWKGTQTIEHRAFTLHLESTFNIRERRAQSRVKLRWQGSHRRRVQEEVVTERCFSRTELGGALDAAGFHVCSAEDFNFADVPGKTGLKTLWVAQKIQ
jgi:SAM-dependent methyltransferase